MSTVYVCLQLRFFRSIHTSFNRQQNPNVLAFKGVLNVNIINIIKFIRLLSKELFLHLSTFYDSTQFKAAKKLVPIVFPKIH